MVWKIYIWNKNLLFLLSGYKLKYKSSDEGTKAEEILIPNDVNDTESTTVSVKLHVSSIQSPRKCHTFNVWSLGTRDWTSLQNQHHCHSWECQQTSYRV